MKVILLQVRLDSRSQAANLQRLGAAMDRAAKTELAPDLLVLPGACDTGGVTSTRRGHEAGLVGVRETIAFKAREWGVYVAAGLHEPRGDARAPVAVLFDPDGDIVARSASPDGGEDDGSPQAVGLWRSPVGDIGVVEPTIAGALTDSVTARERTGIIAMPLPASSTARWRRAVDANLASLRGEPVTGSKSFWAVVCPAGASDEPQSEGSRITFLRDPGGAVLASASSVDETMVSVEVPIGPATDGP
jgi:hypothetical protein